MYFLYWVFSSILSGFEVSYRKSRCAELRCMPIPVRSIGHIALIVPNRSSARGVSNSRSVFFYPTPPKAASKFRGRKLTREPLHRVVLGNVKRAFARDSFRSTSEVARMTRRDSPPESHRRRAERYERVAVRYEGPRWEDVCVWYVSGKTTSWDDVSATGTLSSRCRISVER